MDGFDIAALLLSIRQAHSRRTVAGDARSEYLTARIVTDQ
jgi:hypothetical protein